MSKDLLPAWRNVEFAITVSRRYTYGDLIPYDELYEMLALPRPPTDARADAMDSWRLRILQEISALRQEMLIEHQMMLETELGVGLRILLPCDQTAASEAALRKELMKSLRQHRDRILNVDHSQLTASQRQENVDAQVRMAKRVQAIRGIEHSRLINLPPP